MGVDALIQISKKKEMVLWRVLLVTQALPNINNPPRRLQFLTVTNQGRWFLMQINTCSAHVASEIDQPLGEEGGDVTA